MVYLHACTLYRVVVCESDVNLLRVILYMFT